MRQKCSSDCRDNVALLYSFVDRYLTDRVKPGDRVAIVGVYSIRKVNANKQSKQSNFAGVRIPYVSFSLAL